MFFSISIFDLHYTLGREHNFWVFFLCKNAHVVKLNPSPTNIFGLFGMSKTRKLRIIALWMTIRTTWTVAWFKLFSSFFLGKFWKFFIHNFNVIVKIVKCLFDGLLFEYWQPRDWNGKPERCLNGILKKIAKILTK